MSYIKQIKNIVESINQHPLGAKHKLKAYYKFVTWQIYCLLNGKAKKVNFTDKTFLSVKKGMVGATGNIYTGLHEFNDMGFLLHFLNREDLFLDIGANIGSYTILASGHIGANTIAFEPIPSTYESLVRNVEINNIQSKVKALQVGVGSKNGTLSFTSNLDSVNHVNIQANEESSENIIEVEVVTIDKVLINDREPSLIKIDVEGFETEVLKGMDATLRNSTLKAVLIELNGSGERYGYDESMIHELFISYGFKACEYNPFKRKITLLKTYGIFNTLYLRDFDFVEKRILNAEKVMLFSESF